MFKIFPSIALVMVVTTTLFVSGVAAVKLSQTIPHIDETIAAPSNLQQIDSALGLSSSINNSNPAVNNTGTTNTANTNGQTVATKTNPSAKTTNIVARKGTSTVANAGCVVTISGNKYEITSLKATHSGGNVFTCGSDMTASYKSQHGSNLNRMQAYKITNTGTTNTTAGTTNTTTNTGTTNTTTTTGGTIQPPTSSSFTAATLAQHNTPNNCYIAYKGTVYNVSNHPSWRGCSHYGNRGGIDITSIFPHRTTYLSSLTVVGTYTGPVNKPINNGGQGRNDDNEKERENERNEQEKRSREKERENERNEQEKRSREKERENERNDNDNDSDND